MEQGEVSTEKRMRLRYAGTCRVCGTELPEKSEAVYERATKTVRCVAHDDVPAGSPKPIMASEPVDPGMPGASARREYDRRKTNREQRTRAKHPKLGGLIIALSEEKQSTKAWDTGAIGEERLGNRLNDLASETVRLLHDRRIPGSRANIDHLVVTPTGVYVIDAKRYKGRPSLKVEGGILRPRVERLLVGSRDCTKVVDGVLKQMQVVTGVIGDQVPVHGVLCFVEADWPLLGGSFTTRGVEVLWRKKLASRLGTSGPLGPVAIGDIHRELATALPRA